MQIEEVQNLCLFIKSSAVNPDRKEILLLRRFIVASFRWRRAVEIDFPYATTGVYANSLMAEKQD